MSKLSNDYARCRGVGSNEEGWREDCEECLRRTAPKEYGEDVRNIEPELIVVFECTQLLTEEDIQTGGKWSSIPWRNKG